MIEKPRLVFRVGISGHRPDRLGEAGADEDVLREQVRVALQLVADTVREVQLDRSVPYAPGEPILRLISPLAEGSDRLCARVALDLGFELDVVLPFERGAYELDFVSKGDESPADTRPEFWALLRKARRVLELDSDPEHDAAYVAVGTTTVSQCDLLLAIWDGKAAQGPGGVADNVAEALRIELRTLWIDAHGATKHAMGLASMQDGKIVRQPWDPEEVATRVRVLIESQLAH